jgi:replicative DNA helicase
MQGIPLMIDDQAGLTWPMIRARAMRLHRRNPIRLMVVDHLGLARPSAEMRNAQRVHQLGEVTRGAKELAKAIKAPVLLLAQLNRDLERRDNKRPMMADLRDSGEIEQDADTILFIHRPETYTRRDMLAAKGDQLAELEDQLVEEVGLAEVIFGKNRGGKVPPEPVRVNCDMASNRFWDRGR